MVAQCWFSQTKPPCPAVTNSAAGIVLISRFFSLCLKMVSNCSITILKHTRNVFSCIASHFDLRIWKNQMEHIFSYLVQTFQQVDYFPYQQLDFPLFLIGLFWINKRIQLCPFINHTPEAEHAEVNGRKGCLV